MVYGKAMQELIYDWNPKPHFKKPELCDETLRDGLQSPSIQEPDLETKCHMLHLMNELGITIANIGLPGAGARATQNTLHLAKYIAGQKFSLKANCAARTLEIDIKPIVEIQNAAGIPIIAYCFLGTSPIRQAVEDWDLDKLLKTCETAINFAHAQNLEVAFVTEDTTRSHPNTLRILFQRSIDMGVHRLVLCDTCGHITPEGVSNLVAWTRKLVGNSVALDWHGHNDRGLSLINAMTAAGAGCERIHGTCLGIGERVGNTSMDQLILNLKLLGPYTGNTQALREYTSLVSKACKIPIPYNYPVFGRDAFRTATGVHAAAVIKAKQKDKPGWADLVYSSVSAREFGLKQIIEIGPMSGFSNIHHWLSERNLTATEAQVAQIFQIAKDSKHVLSDAQIRGCLV